MSDLWTLDDALLGRLDEGNTLSAGGLTFRRTIVDDAGVTDTPATYDYTDTVTDGQGMSDDGIYVLGGLPGDPVGMTDQVTATDTTGIHTRTLTDGLSATEPHGFFFDGADVAGASDNMSAAKTSDGVLIRTVVDPVGLDDQDDDYTVTTRITVVGDVAVSDVSAGTKTSGGSAAHTRTVTDDAAVSDTLIQPGVELHTRTVTDLAGVADSVVRVLTKPPLVVPPSLSDGKLQAKIEIAFNATPNLRPVGGGNWWTLDDPLLGRLDEDGTLAPDDVWVDVTSWVRDGASIKRGRERELDAYQTGRASFVLSNRDRTFDPTNTLSPFFGDVGPMRPVRISAVVGGQTVRVFTGFITDWTQQYEPADATVTVACQDAFTVLAANDLDETSPQGAGETSGHRVRRVLDDDNVRFGSQRLVDDGLSTVAATTFGVNALQHVKDAANAEAGFVFVDRSGTFTFRNRHATVSTDTVAVFAGSNVDEDGIVFHDIEQTQSNDLLFNRVVVSGDSGTEFVAEDDTSRDLYLTRTLTRTGLLLDNDTHVEGMADFLLGRFAVPEVRFGRLQVKLHDRPRITDAERVQVLRLDVTDRIDVWRDAFGAGVPQVIVRNVIVDGVEHRIFADRWTTTFALASADTVPYLRLDDPEYGRLDHNRLTY